MAKKDFDIFENVYKVNAVNSHKTMNYELVPFDNCVIGVFMNGIGASNNLYVVDAVAKPFIAKRNIYSDKSFCECTLVNEDGFRKRVTLPCYKGEVVYEKEYSSTVVDSKDYMNELTIAFMKDISTETYAELENALKDLDAQRENIKIRMENIEAWLFKHDKNFE